MQPESGTPTMTATTNDRDILPDNIKPVHYDLTIKPDFKDFTFKGRVVIEYYNLL